MSGGKRCLLGFNPRPLPWWGYVKRCACPPKVCASLPILPPPPSYPQPSSLGGGDGQGGGGGSNVVLEHCNPFPCGLMSLASTSPPKKIWRKNGLVL